MANLNNLTANITALTHDGRGIAQVNGKTTFISGALPGEEVLFSVTKKKGKYDEGQVTEILKKSPDRINPVCQHFSICGGCALQHLSPPAQVLIKQKILLDQLKHFGNVEPLEILPPLLGPTINYRRKARLSVKYVEKKSTVLVGFHEKNGRYIAELNCCEVLAKPFDALIDPLKKLILNLKSFRDIPQIEIAQADQTNALVFRHLVPLSPEDLQELKNFSKEHSLHCYLQPQGPDSVHLLWPENNFSELLTYHLPKYNLELDFHPCGFIQINDEINQKLIDLVLNLLAVEKNDRVLDLFCGIGNFTLPLARFCGEAIGIEGDAGLIAQANKNAIKNNISNVNFHHADLNTASLASYKCNKILLDPPRTGALAVAQQIPKIKPERIVYVSCNPATLARDAGELAKQGFVLEKVGVLDMFPHTHHIEAIAVLTNKK